MIHVSVHGTTRCDTGCANCSFNSCPKGDDLPLEAIKKLRQSIKSYRGKVEVAFTGSGEPLKWQDLPEAISILKPLPRVSFGLVTSGCKNKQDERFAVLREAFKVEDLIQVFHSFNLFSPSFPERLAFSLPFILEKSRYAYTGIKLTSGFSPQDDQGNEARIHVKEVTEAFELALEQAVGKCSRLEGFPVGNNFYAKLIATILKQQRIEQSFKKWFTYKSFLFGAIYRPYDLAFRDRTIQTVGAPVFLQGRFKRFATPDLADYAYGEGFYCDGYGDFISLSAKGQFIFCPYRPNFPPLILGEVGGSLEKAVLTKRKLTYEWLNLPRLELSGKGRLHDPCDNCVTHAWDVFNERGYDYLN